MIGIGWAFVISLVGQIGGGRVEFETELDPRFNVSLWNHYDIQFRPGSFRKPFAPLFARKSGIRIRDHD